jgi:hypothetical protein
VVGMTVSKSSFGNWFGDVCRATGVPGRAHRLRKALASRLAEKGATVAMLDALFALRGGAMPSFYTRQASRLTLARSAIALLGDENEAGSSYPRTLQEIPRTLENS